MVLLVKKNLLSQIIYDCAKIIFQLDISSLDDPFESLLGFRMQLNVSFFMEVIMCWSIWMVRNDLILRDIQPSLQRCRDYFRDEFALVILREKQNLPDAMSSWIHNMM